MAIGFGGVFAKLMADFLGKTKAYAITAFSQEH
jgi:hypothetical protein